MSDEPNIVPTELQPGDPGWEPFPERAYATILHKGRGWVTIAHHPGGIDTTIGRFTAKYKAKECADKFNNSQTNNRK